MSHSCYATIIYRSRVVIAKGFTINTHVKLRSCLPENPDRHPHTSQSTYSTISTSPFLPLAKTSFHSSQILINSST